MYVVFTLAKDQTTLLVSTQTMNTNNTRGFGRFTMTMIFAIISTAMLSSTAYGQQQVAIFDQQPQVAYGQVTTQATGVACAQTGGAVLQHGGYNPAVLASTGVTPGKLSRFCHVQFVHADGVVRACGLTVEQHIMLNSHPICPDQMGSSPFDHRLYRYGDLVKIRRASDGQEVLAYPHAQAAMVQFAKEEVCTTTTASASTAVAIQQPLVQTTVITTPVIKQDNCHYKGRANPAVPRRDP